MFGTTTPTKKYKIAIILSLIIACNITLYAQRLPKYDNVYKEAIAAENKNYAYALFTDYLNQSQLQQNQTIERSNLYFQLGTLAYDLAQTFDPLAQYNDYISYATKADEYLRLFIQQFTESDVKRDNEFFQGIEAADKKLTFAEVYDFVNKKIEINKENIRQTQKLYNAYNGLNRNYTIAQNTYKILCDKFINIKDAYLLIDNDIETKMYDMQTAFDSVLHYYDAYKTLFDKNNIKAYTNVEVTFEDIIIFRVDGLSTANFNSPKTTVWDYGAWAKQFLNNVEAFASVYQEVIDASNTLNERITWFNSNRTLSDNYVGYEVDEAVMDSLNLFGYYQALNRLIIYKQEKLNFLTLSRKKINSPDYDDNGKLSITDKMYYYERLQNAYYKLENIRKDLEGYAVSANNAVFTAMDFKNHDDFLEYLHDELLENRIEMDAGYANLQKYVIRGENNIRRTNYVNYKKNNIPLYLSNGFYRSSLPLTYITKNIISANSGIYLSGSNISKDGFATAYVALCDTDTTNVTWLKNIDVGKFIYDNCATAITPTFDGGCFVLVAAKNVSDPDLMYSTVIQYSPKGNEIKRIVLPEKTLGMGRYMNYDDVNEHLLMAFYGANEFMFDPDGKLVLQKIDLNNTILMSAELKLSGEIIDIIPSNNGLLVVGNYNSIVDEKGITHKLNTDGIALQSSIFSALFSADGKLITVNRYPVNQSGYAIRAVKITGNSINIIGQKGWGRKDPAVPFSNDELIYILIDAKGNLLYSNQKTEQN